MTNLVDQFTEAAHKTVRFVDYIEDFYGKNGIYDLGATRQDCKEACLIYLIALATDLGPCTWGGGDSIDRERVRVVLEEILNCKEKV
jgi:hypothetical protein